jgi:hypothetical protein
MVASVEGVFWGIYILDSLGWAWHRLRDRLARLWGVYVLAPTKIWIAVSFMLCVLNPTSLVAMSASCNAETSAAAAGPSVALCSGWICISTSVAPTAPDISLSVPCVIKNAFNACHLICTQPAATRTGCKSHQKSACSPVLPNPESNLVPAKGLSFSVITSVLPRRTSRLGVLNLDNVSCASAAFWLASAARLLASTAFSSDLRLNSFWRNPAILPKIISIATPIATKLSPIADPHCSKKESYSGWYPAIATVAATP